MTAGSRTASDQLIASLRRRVLDVISSLIAPGTRCALLDFPNHPNAGDSAIWLGEEVALAELGVEVSHVSHSATFAPEELRRRLDADVLLLHGGGNLGDVWPRRQRFREAIVRAFPDRKIIQLPQTVHFKDHANIQSARRVFDEHPDFTLLVRDARSLDIASRAFGAPAVLCPDMAFVLGSLERPRRPRWPILWLARSDHESSGHPVPPGVKRGDWPAERARIRAQVLRLHTWRARRAGPVGHGLRHLAGAFHSQANRRLVDGLRHLAGGRVVVSDRLHAHILALLMGIPHVLLDNSYRKVSSFYETWTRDCSDAVWAESAREALARATALAGGS